MTDAPYAANPLRSYSWHLFHRWSIWQQYEWKGGAIFEGKPITKTEQRQKRHCVICGYQQDELVRDG